LESFRLFALKLRPAISSHQLSYFAFPRFYARFPVGDDRSYLIVNAKESTVLHNIACIPFSASFFNSSLMDLPLFPTIQRTVHPFYSSLFFSFPPLPSSIFFRHTFNNLSCCECSPPSSRSFIPCFLFFNSFFLV